MDWSGIIVAALGLLAGGTGGWFLFRGKKVDAEVQVEATEAASTTAFLQGQQAFQEYTNKLVAESVEAAVKPMREQLAEMQKKLETVSDESHEMKQAMKAQATQLWLWDIRGRTGPLPMYPPAILQRLELGYMVPHDDLDDTIEMEGPR